jgi:hypothetical protein
MRFRGWKIQWLAAGLLAALVIAAVGLAQTATGSSVLSSAGLKAAPVRYTELAFKHPTLLPEKFPDGKFKVHAPFTLHNAEGRSFTYHWIVQEIDGNDATTVASGASHAAKDETFPVNPVMKLECTHAGRVKVVVRLKQPARTIGWWGECLPKKLPGQVKKPATAKHRRQPVHKRKRR